MKNIKYFPEPTNGRSSILETHTSNSVSRMTSKKGKGRKVAHTRLPSVGFWSWSRFLALSLQVTWVINPAVGCHYFLPGLQLPLQPLRGLLPISLLGERGTMGVNSLPKTVTRQRRDCDLNPGPSAPESSTLTTRLPSHPVGAWLLTPLVLFSLLLRLPFTSLFTTLLCCKTDPSYTVSSRMSPSGQDGSAFCVFSA